MKKTGLDFRKQGVQSLKELFVRNPRRVIVVAVHHERFRQEIREDKRFRFVQASSNLKLLEKADALVILEMNAGSHGLCFKFSGKAKKLGIPVIYVPRYQNFSWVYSGVFGEIVPKSAPTQPQALTQTTTATATPQSFSSPPQMVEAGTEIGIEESMTQRPETNSKATNQAETPAGIATIAKMPDDEKQVVLTLLLEEFNKQSNPTLTSRKLTEILRSLKLEPIISKAWLKRNGYIQSHSKKEGGRTSIWEGTDQLREIVPALETVEPVSQPSVLEKIASLDKEREELAGRASSEIERQITKLNSKACALREEANSVDDEITALKKQQEELKKR